MITIEKFHIPAKTGGVLSLQLPGSAIILSLLTQGYEPFLWAMVSPDAQLESRHFRWFATGDSLTADVYTKNFVGTVQLRFGPYEYHLFEVSSS